MDMGAAQALGGVIPERPDTIFGGERIQGLAIAIDDVCIEADIIITVADISMRTFWVPRDLNVDADLMSRY